MPNGDQIKPGVTFLDIRSWYKNDPSWPIVEAAKTAGVAPVFLQSVGPAIHHLQ